jgi:hypothetical protein
MTELQASRTLVKSPPELWAECSDAASLARHLGQFGEIRITRLDPETAVAWEGEHARGTVRIEPSGWGTKVILTAVAVSEDPPPAAAEEPPEAPAEMPAGSAPAEVPAGSAPAEVPAGSVPAGSAPAESAPAEVPVGSAPADPLPAPDAESPPPRRRRFARLFGRRRPVEPPAEPVAVESPPAEPVAVDPPGPEPEVVDAEPPPAASNDTEAALAAALDSLGQAHHRPYSRA